MKFGILVNEGPYTHQASDSAYLFTRAALEKGHEIFRVFFYHDGVNNATKYTEPPQDDRHIVNRWSKLAEQYEVDLVVCVAAALRRGIKDELLAPGCIGSVYLSAVAPAPHGAWPLGVAQEYPIDDAHLVTYARAARTREGFRRYLEQWVLTPEKSCSPA